MLILTRYRDEKIFLDNLIEINVMNVNRNGSVAIGIKAPRAVPVNREEIYAKIKETSPEEVSFKLATDGFTEKDLPGGYLILTRFKNQKIRICDDVVLTLLDVNRGVARIGIDAPKDVAINREEIQKKINAGEKPKA